MRPAALDRLPEAGRVYLDVRDDIRGGREPFRRIMAAVDALGPDGMLVLRVPFEPVPLYSVLSRRGFEYFAERRAPDDWTVAFYRDPATLDAASSQAPAPRAAARSASPPAPPAPPAGPVRLDVRGLEPPLPLVRVLEAVEGLVSGQRLEVLHDRRPLFLYPQLEARGLDHATDEPEPGLVRIAVWRKGSAV